VRRFTDCYTFRFDVAPEALWRAVSDTDAVNRDAGFPAVRYTFEPREGGGTATIARARLGPLAFEWEEPPFTWEAPHRVAIERRFRGGPFARFSSDVRVVPDGAGARIEHAVELDARDALGALLAPAVMARGRAGAERAYAHAGRRAAETAAAPPTRAVVPEVPPASVARATRFADALEALRPHTEHEPQIAARLASVVEHGDDALVARLRPYVLADSWGLPRERVLAAMLAATRGGLLDLSWTLICPSCRGQKNRLASLAAVGGEVHCDQCGIAYGADFDRNVEVTFDAGPSGRTATPPVYCVSGPQTARQTLAQTAVAAGGSAALNVLLAPGAYVAQVLPDRVVRFTAEPDAGADALDVRIDPANGAGEPGRVHASAAAVRAGVVRVQIANASARAAVVRVTEAELSDQIATAADVTALQAFRDLFSSEVLGEGIEVAIRSMTMVFTDVVGSTRMYSDSGDARAFRLVREHFDALHEVIALRRGAIVKTIGDAVMAVFAEPRDAVESALLFGSAVAPLQLRIGMHRGPCIAVRANDRIDYFGATVNLASRVEHAARAGEILMTSAVADDPRVAEIMPPGERGTVTLRGIPEPVDVVRVPAVAAERSGANELPGANERVGVEERVDGDERVAAVAPAERVAPVAPAERVAPGVPAERAEPVP
jgi:class 3 adenylate cyclase